MKKTRLILWCEKCKKDTLHEEVGEEEFGAIVSGQKFLEILKGSLKNKKPLELPRTTWKKYKCLRCGAISYLSKIIS